MSFETAKDVLDRAKEFHGELGQFYSQLCERSKDERIKMFLYYLVEHEKKHEESLARYEDTTNEKILKTWFQFTPPKEALATGNLHVEDIDGLTIDGIEDLAMQQDERLVELYKTMIENSDTDEMKALFNNLLEMEIHEESELATNASRLKRM